MKVKMIIFATMMAIASVAHAQTENKKGFEISEISISSGKGALTSGFDSYVGFSHGENGILFFQANNDRLCINIGKSFGNLKLIESVGVFKNIPWTGPMILYQLGPIDMIAWNGFGFAKNKEVTVPGWKPQFFVSYEGLGLTFLKSNRIGASVMWFATAPMNWFISYKKVIPVNENSKFYGEITYNHNLDIPMFNLGYTYRFTTKK